jgi:hypothetical protein
MAYSIDSQQDLLFSGVQSLQETITLPDGAHVLDVKAWGTEGSLCERTFPVNVGNGVNVSAPAPGSIVTSPFLLQAEAPSCGGQTTHSLAYELEPMPNPREDEGLGPHHEHGTTVLNASVSASTGMYLLRVKARGDSGAYCETDVNLTVAESSGLTPPSGASSYVHMENDKTYTGSYASCGGAIGPNVNLWQTQPDCATVGIKSGSTSIVSTPTYGGEADSREFTMTYDTSGGGVRWFDKAIPVQSSAMHFQYDAYVNIVDSSKVGELELDINHSINSPLSTVYILAAQCNLTKGVWQVTANKTWVNTNAACTLSQVTSGVWHHFQIQTHHDPDGGTGIYYDAVALDGNVTKITSCTNPSTGAAVACQSTSRNLGWGPLIGPNFQIDGKGPGGAATAYVDDFTVFYW